MKKLILAFTALALSTSAFAMSKAPDAVPVSNDAIGAREVSAVKAEVAKVVVAYNAAPRATQSQVAGDFDALNIASARIDLAKKAKNRAVFEQEAATIRTVSVRLCTALGGC